MGDWVESIDEPGTWRLRAGPLELSVYDWGDKGASAAVSFGGLTLWRAGMRQHELTVESGKAAAIAKAREWACAINAALPPATSVFGDCSGPFISRCQACMEKRSPHCDSTGVKP